MFQILVVDDEPSMVAVITEILKRKDYSIHQVSNGKKALELIKTEPIDLILCDMKMPLLDGVKVLKRAKQIKPRIPFIILTAYASITDAVECMRNGAYDYITKPVNMEELRLMVRRALQHRKLVEENVFLKKQLHDKYSFENIIGKSIPMQRVYEVMEKVAQTDSTILIYGESGTGKELVAQAIHYHSPRRERPFVTINCGGLPESLLESELFGHIRGAFTSAINDKKGLFQVADGGTIFLDEISATSLSIQVKLLRVLQEREIKQVGDTKDISVDVRVIAATNKKLEEEVRESKFREDLYYRLSVIPVDLPPLRDRKDDLPLLVQHFLNKYCQIQKKEQKTLAPGIMDILMGYNWPGNVRELENVIEHAVALGDSMQIFPKDLPPSILENSDSRKGTNSVLLKEAMREKEKDYILKVIKQSGGDKKQAACLLGIDLATLYRKLQ